METAERIRESRTHDDDRRRLGWRTMVFGYARSRRRSSRREADGEALFLDWHHPWLFFLATGTMILSCMDAFLTLQMLERGAVEINPIMNAAIGHSIALFAASKVALTGFGILVLVFLSRARFMDRFRSGILLTMFFSFYACLVCYEFVSLLSIA
jgi:hypothetical protein